MTLIITNLRWQRQAGAVHPVISKLLHPVDVLLKNCVQTTIEYAFEHVVAEIVLA